MIKGTYRFHKCLFFSRLLKKSKKSGIIYLTMLLECKIMRTERLFDIDSKITAFEATVLSCEKTDDGKFAITLEKLRILVYNIQYINVPLFGNKKRR
jgi:hypothetical protein